MATTKPKTPPKPTKAAAAQTAENAAALAGAAPDDQHPVGAVNTVDISSDTAVQALASSNEPVASNEVNPQLAEANNKAKPKLQAWAAEGAEIALDRLDKIETEAIRMGGDSGQIIRQLACEAMVALGKK